MLNIFNRNKKSEGAEAFELSPFHRLARTQAMSVAGDTLLTISLADSLFFDVDPNGARWRVALYLVLTIAPFAFVAPFLGPAMDRFHGGHRVMIIVSAAVRAVVMVLMIQYLQTPFLFPLAFTMLVMGKTYAVAKSAVVPSTAENEDDLVKVNSRLAVLASIAGAVAAAPGVLLLKFGGATWVLGLGALVYVLAVVFAFKIPAADQVQKIPGKIENVVPKVLAIRFAAMAMGFIRAGVGFVTMLLAFALRGGVDPGPEGAGVQLGHAVRNELGEESLVLATGGSPPWYFGVALLGAGLGGFIGSAGVPRVRAIIKEERILGLALVSLTALASFAAVVSAELGAAFVMAFAIALVAGGGKQAFDAIVQRDAPHANLGRSFSKFESRFQLLWVLGALVPVVFTIEARVGYLVVAGASALIVVMYWLGKMPSPNLFRGKKSPGEDSADTVSAV